MINVGRGRLVGIVDYQAGNLHSIESAFAYLGARTIRLRSDAQFASCSHVVLPGVGAFGFCASRLRESGLVDSVYRWSLADAKPLLGICVGMQLLADLSDESPSVEGLGWIGGSVKLIPTSPGIHVPHVGWNTVRFAAKFGNFAQGSEADFYFDHSFAYHDPRTGQSLAECKHGKEFSAVIQRENIVACQFHPEKSQTAGMRFLSGFLIN